MSSKTSTNAMTYPSMDTIITLEQFHTNALDFFSFPKKYRYTKLDKIMSKVTKCSITQYKLE